MFMHSIEAFVCVLCIIVVVRVRRNGYKKNLIPFLFFRVSE